MIVVGSLYCYQIGKFMSDTMHKYKGGTPLWVFNFTSVIFFDISELYGSLVSVQVADILYPGEPPLKSNPRSV